MAKSIDISNRQFYQLKVLSFEGKDGSGAEVWKCKCVCENIIPVRRSYLTMEVMRHCGCLGDQIPEKEKRTHGMSNTMTYSSWAAMKKRCDNPKDSHYGSYGARGIGYDQRWRQFENFYADMGERPSPECSLERKNNDGSYNKDNCVWLETKLQQRNTSRVVRLIFNGETKIITEWADQLGFKFNTLQSRIKKGWTIEKALTTPLREHTVNITYANVTMNLTGWAKKIGISAGTLRTRLFKYKWPIEQALNLPGGQRKKGKLVETDSSHIPPF